MDKDAVGTEQIPAKNGINTNNSLLDYMKGIGCLFVVLVHYPMPGAFGRILSSVGVCAVILFFLISGYYSYRPIGGAGKIAQRLKRNVCTLSIVLLLHIAFTAVEQFCTGNFAQWLNDISSPMVWVRFFTLGDFELFHCYQLWFWLALVYAYIFFCFVEKHGLYKTAYSLLPALLLLRIGMETYTNTTGTDWHLSGNAIVGALPIMVLGHYIAHKEEQVQKIDSKRLLLLSAAGMLFVFICVAHKWKIDISQIGKIWAAAAFFMLAVKNPHISICAAVESIGRRLSLYIYIIHVAVGIVIKDIFTFIGLPEVCFDYLLPLLTIAASCLLSELIARKKESAQSRAVGI